MKDMWAGLVTKSTLKGPSAADAKKARQGLLIRSAFVEKERSHSIATGDANSNAYDSEMESSSGNEDKGDRPWTPGNEDAIDLGKSCVSQVCD
jgi:hypothetical protein